ncbi:hypothetical protein QY97_03577 [Bacillus thermotolerans]|nr:hypothetical protein QY97_03577 [Bacillus thermotolerans]
MIKPAYSRNKKGHRNMRVCSKLSVSFGGPIGYVMQFE